ncbi:DUF6879 family protein [Actinomadura harenae]|uniref:DUF6879 domain-containing protein n=1 Tax=Actinomadura harenae TaxID=2483351 RepID=A0A3M2LLV2_9ACTN|nr:DUF6879 family protein [Actinomadura harenae]RMI38409.1 hypothetical protein EBO15_32990 [Actinomadura harenae]
MELISVKQRASLIWAGRPFLKLELRDSYAFDAELFDAWRRQDEEAMAPVVDGWRDRVASEVAAGRRLRRVRVVSEPLSEYQRMAVDISGSAVEAGEELRWLPRRLVSALPLPGNDCFILDDLVIFNVLGGSDERVEIQLYREPDVVEFCRDAFEAAWKLATPHSEYKPA